MLVIKCQSVKNLLYEVGVVLHQENEQKITSSGYIDNTQAFLLIVMGVSGTGKSTLARVLADELCATYIDADDFHNDEAKRLMAQNIALTEKQRLPWLQRVCLATEEQLRKKHNVVLAYSGLKKHHRQLFRQLADYLTVRVMFLCLQGKASTIAERMKARAGHFVNEGFLLSQFADFEQPNTDEDDISVLDIECSKKELVSRGCAQVKDILLKENY